MVADSTSSFKGQFLSAQAKGNHDCSLAKLRVRTDAQGEVSVEVIAHEVKRHLRAAQKLQREPSGR